MTKINKTEDLRNIFKTLSDGKEHTVYDAYNLAKETTDWGKDKAATKHDNQNQDELYRYLTKQIGYLIKSGELQRTSLGKYKYIFSYQEVKGVSKTTPTPHEKKTALKKGARKDFQDGLVLPLGGNICLSCLAHGKSIDKAHIDNDRTNRSPYNCGPLCKECHTRLDGGEPLDKAKVIQNMMNNIAQNMKFEKQYGNNLLKLYEETLESAKTPRSF